MPREVVARILDIEEDAAQVTADAQQQAEQILTEAREAVADLRQRLLGEAEARADRIIEEGRDKAAQEREALMADAKQDVEQLEALAQGHVDAAVRFVLNQVVESAQTR